MHKGKQVGLQVCVWSSFPVLKVDIYRIFSAVFSLDAAIFGKLRYVRHYALMSQQWACAERAQSENNQVITFTWDDIYFDRSMKWLNLPPTPATDWNLVLACLFWLRCLYGAFLFCWAFKPFIIAAQCQMPTCLTSELTLLFERQIVLLILFTCHPITGSPWMPSPATSHFRVYIKNVCSQLLDEQTWIFCRHPRKNVNLREESGLTKLRSNCPTRLISHLKCSSKHI